MPDAPVPIAPGVRVLDHAVLRVAAWPIELADPLLAPSLAAAARTVVADRGAPTAATDAAASDAARALADRIHALVPAVADRTTRRWLLDARRALVDPARLVPPMPSGASDAVADLHDGPAILTLIAAVAAPRAAAATRRAAFADAFAVELERSRHALRALGASDRFRAALAVAEPTVAVRWDATRDKPLSDKARVRRLEATVLHFAMRACGRPTPNGGWAGVAPVLPAVGPSGGDVVMAVEDAPRAVHVSVDLVPFAAVLASWAHQLGSSADHPLRREPTLHDEPSGSEHRWAYLRRDTEPSSFALLATVPELREAMAWWPAGATASPAALYAHVGEAPGRAIVDHLLACGVLHTALQLPTFAASPSEALASVTPLLPDPLATRWVATLTAIDEAAAAMADAFLADDVEGVVRDRAGVVAAVSALTLAAGLGEVPEHGLVHLDLQVPWRGRWTAAGRAAVGDAIDAVFAFHADDGGAEAYRSTMAERVRSTLAPRARPGHPFDAEDVLAGVAATASHWVEAPAPVATRSELLRAVGVDPSPSEARWSDHLDPAATGGRPVHQLVVRPTAHRAGAAGSFVVGVSGSTVWARWGRPQPGMFVTRFAALPGGAAVLASLSVALERLPARRVIGADAPNPNAALRPSLAGAPPWGWSLSSPAAVADGTDIGAPTDGRIVETADGLIVRDRERDGDERIPVYDSAAVIGSRDPVTRFVRTVAMTHGWELAAWGFPVLGAEVDRWPSLPRLVLPSTPARRSAGPAPGTVLAARRWVIGGPVLDAIRADPDDAERYLRWREVMDERDVPARVIARWHLRPDVPELLLVTESPLALRCLCERLPDGPATLVLTELPAPIEGWPVRSSDGHHLSELAVTWMRRPDELDPSVFPGGAVPASFGAVLDALRDDRDAAPAAGPGDDALVRAHLAALLDELVDAPERARVAHAAGAWLRRVADAQDPGGHRTPASHPTAAASERLLADLRSLRPWFDADVAAAVSPAIDASTIRSQLVARLAHIDAVGVWGEGPDRLRQEADRWLELAGGDDPAP